MRDGPNLMRRVISAVATLVAGIGLLWEFGKTFLDWVGRLLAMRDLNEGFDHIRHTFEAWISHHPAIGEQIGPWVLMMAGLGSLAVVHIWPIIRSRMTASPVDIVFPNECNLEYKVGHPFKRSSTPLFSGHPLDQRSVHEFFVGVHNPNPKKTLRNVRALIECNQYGSMFSAYLLCERTSTDAADITPHMTDYFLIGKGVDSSKDGMFSPKINPSSEYMAFLKKMEQNPHAGFVVFGKGVNPLLLKNNGIPLTVTVFADDTPSVSREFVLNTRERIGFFAQKHGQPHRNDAKS
jgi:hypothetical protein